MHNMIPNINVKMLTIEVVATFDSSIGFRDVVGGVIEEGVSVETVSSVPVELSDVLDDVGVVELGPIDSLKSSRELFTHASRL